MIPRNILKKGAFTLEDVSPFKPQLKPGVYVLHRRRKSGKVKPHDVAYRIIKVLHPDSNPASIVAEVMYPDYSIGERKWDLRHDTPVSFVHILTPNPNEFGD